MNKDDSNDPDSSLEDLLLWSRDLEKHSLGEFSFTVVQANEVIEDQSLVETSQSTTFDGVNDSDGGPEASRYMCDHPFLHLVSEFFGFL
jgi:pyruvate dehydrogenase phosphatase